MARTRGRLVSDTTVSTAPSSFDEQVAKDLMERARREGVSLVDAGGLLQGLTKTVLEARPGGELADVHRLKAWPFFTWLVVDSRMRPNLELLLAKPPGVGVGVWWSIANPAMCSASPSSPNGSGGARTGPVKALAELTDDDFDTSTREAEGANVAASTHDRLTGRCLALRQLCFQAGIVRRWLEAEQVTSVRSHENWCVHVPHR
jgi:hypothetical protein